MISKKDVQASQQEIDALVVSYLKLPWHITRIIALDIIISGAFYVLWALPMKIAWNYVMPQIFHLPAIGYLQMWCLLMLLASLWKITPVVITNNVKTGKVTP